MVCGVSKPIYISKGSIGRVVGIELQEALKCQKLLILRTYKESKHANSPKRGTPQVHGAVVTNCLNLYFDLLPSRQETRSMVKLQMMFHARQLLIP